MEQNIVQEIIEQFAGASPRETLDHPAVNVPASALVDVALWLRDHKGYDMLMDVTAIDWGMDASPRFTGIYHLYSLATAALLRIAADAEGDEHPVLPSLVSVWPAADWPERETFDLLGVRYSGHPDLRRILMWDDYPYHPLRKEFPLAGIETDLPAADVALASGAKVLPAPMAGGPFHSPQAIAMRYREPRAADQSWNEQHPKPACAAAEAEAAQGDNK